MSLPRSLETERLLLRQFREDDFADYAKLCSDPDVMRFLGGVMTPLEAWRHMSFLVGHWQLRGYGMFAAEEKASGRFIGRIGFMNPGGWPGFELGWTLSREFQGKGYATEGAKRLLEIAFHEMNQPHVISLINRDNAPSIRVAERLGETLEGATEVMGRPVQIYGIDRPSPTRRA